MDGKIEAWFGIGCLLVLTVQTSTLVLFIKYTLERTNYIATSVVVTVELVKLIACFVIEMSSNSSSLSRPATPLSVIKSIWHDVKSHPSQVLKLVVPAALYAVQNNLNYFSLARISAVGFQVTQQLKILTTAIFAIFILDKRLGWRHWIALFLLVFGVIFVQLANLDEKSPTSRMNGNGVFTRIDVWLGFFSMILGSISSGFAGVYYERLVKGYKSSSKPATAFRKTCSMLLDDSAAMLIEENNQRQSRSIWIQSIELGIFGLLFSSLIAFSGENLLKIQTFGFFVGYDRNVLMVILLQAFGGILVAMAVRYADSILKAFATSTSIVLSALISYFFLRERQSFTLQLVLGSAMVGMSLYLYAVADNLHARQLTASKTHQL